MKASKVWDIIAYIGLGIVLLYFLLKAVGVLHSPASAEVVAIAGAGLFLGRYVQKLDHVHDDVEILKTKMTRVERHLPVAFS